MVVAMLGDCGGSGRELRSGPGVAWAGPVQRPLAVVSCAASVMAGSALSAALVWAVS
jgi:hypothetical protein